MKDARLSDSRARTSRRTRSSSSAQSPLVGRDFLPDDDRPGAAAVVILGNGIWKNRYGSDPGVIGRSIKVNDVPSTVIGVMPEGFKFPNSADLWLPLVQMPRLTEQKRDARNLDVFGRLADNVTLRRHSPR